MAHSSRHLIHESRGARAAAVKLVILILTLPMGIDTAQAESLRDIYELAVRNDAQFRAEQAQYRAGLEAENLGRAALLPQLNGSYNYGNSDQDHSLRPATNGGANPVSNTVTNTDIHSEGYEISLDQAIFDLSAWYTFQSSKASTRQAEAEFAADRQSLIMRVVEAYFSVLRAQDQLAASQSAEQAFERQLDQTQQRYNVGQVAITDVNEAQAAYDLSRVNRIEDQNEVRVAQEQLSVLTGRHHENLDVLKDGFNVEMPNPTERSAWVESALANNFDLLAIRYAEETAQDIAKANRFEHAPRIVGGYTYSDYTTDGDLGDPWGTGELDTATNQWRISIEVPLFSGGATSANRRRAAEELNAARERRLHLTRSIMATTRSLYMTVVNDVSRVAARRQSITSSQSALDATRKGYEVGTRDVVDVLNAQNTLIAAQREYANSRYDYILNLLRLKAQAGLLGPDHIEMLDRTLEGDDMPLRDQVATR